MRKMVKWVGIVVGVLVGLVVLAGALVYILSEARISKVYTFDVPEVPIPTDQASITRGEHLASSIRDCVGCHGEDLGGQLFFEDPALGALYATNLTSGKGGIGATYTDEDWVRAIIFGVDPEGAPLLAMPSNEYYFMDNADLGAIIAYVKNVPPVNNEVGENQLKLLPRALFVAGQFPILVPVEMVDPTQPRPDAPETGATVEYGEYLAVTCIGCHGEHFSGGPIPGLPPDFPPGANLTPDVETGLGTWTEEDWVRSMREGKRPDGSDIDSEAMPWPSLGKATDEELGAMWAYFQSLEPMPFGSR
jgi:mono/diheme cytochrome c family protein